MINPYGCTDGGCVMQPPSREGMHTNGGCTCLPLRLTPHDRIRIRKAIRWLAERTVTPEQMGRIVGCIHHPHEVD